MDESVSRERPWLIVGGVVLFFAGSFTGMLAAPKGDVALAPGANPTGLYVKGCNVIRWANPPADYTPLCPTGKCEALLD